MAAELPRASRRLRQASPGLEAYHVGVSAGGAAEEVVTTVVTLSLPGRPAKIPRRPTIALLQITPRLPGTTIG